MKITFLGAAHEVTGSCTLIEVGEKKGLVDCGMEQGKDLFVNQELPVNPADIDFVLLTHAHIDHSGNLPLLYKKGFRGTVYASAATCALCNIMLMDCAHIQMSEAEWKSRKSVRNGGPGDRAALRHRGRPGFAGPDAPLRLRHGGAGERERQHQVHGRGPSSGLRRH